MTFDEARQAIAELPIGGHVSLESDNPPTLEIVGHYTLADLEKIGSVLVRIKSDAPANPTEVKFGTPSAIVGKAP